MDDFDIGLFVAAADVVDLAYPSGFEHPADGAAMVFHIQPVADLLAVTVYRQRLARESINDHQRDELLRKMVGAIVVGAVGGEHR